MTSRGGHRSGTVERAAHDAAFPRVGDALILYLWRRPAFYLTRTAAGAGLSGSMMALLEALLCVLTFWLFWNADYWVGLLAGLVAGLFALAAMMLNRLGNAPRSFRYFAHAIELIAPPFWWWAWEHGLRSAGHPITPVYATMVLWVVVGGYVADQAIDGLSVQRFGGMSIHAWRPVDSYFRLVAAAPNVNLVILAASLLFARPDVGFEAVAWWTLISLIFHSVRFAQATESQARRERIVSWLHR